MRSTQCKEDSIRQRKKKYTYSSLHVISRKSSFVFQILFDKSKIVFFISRSEKIAFYWYPPGKFTEHALCCSVVTLISRQKKIEPYLLTTYDERKVFQSFAQVLKGTLEPMLPEEAGHVEVHMASHRFCLRLCFLGLVTLSLCSIVFIMTRGKDCIFFKISVQIIHVPSTGNWWVA